ncbi:MAG: DUF167 domain-containing protein [Chloroflexota bacterium]
MNVVDRRDGTALTCTLTVKVIPRSGRDEIVGLKADGAWRIRLKAPPVEGRANEALVSFLADSLGVAKDQLEIVAGHAGRRKLLRLTGLAASEAGGRLAAFQRS